MLNLVFAALLIVLAPMGNACLPRRRRSWCPGDTRRPAGARRRAPKQSLRMLDPKREAVIRQALNDVYLKPTRPPFARLVHEVRIRCHQESLHPPSWRTIRQRLVEIDLRTKAGRRGDAAVKATRPPQAATRPIGRLRSCRSTTPKPT